jgi:glutaminyl-peptide cyclotransferase
VLAAAAAASHVVLDARRQRGSPVPAGAAAPRTPAAKTVAAAPVDGSPERLRVRVLASFPHDRESYTQGLLWDAGSFIESAGGYGESTVRRWRPGQQRPLAEARLPDHVFAEGIAAVGERLIQLTWREGLAFYRHRGTLEETARVAYQGEGWGLCYDGERLIMSDGSDRLTQRDPESFAPLREVVVRAGDAPLSNLNELECAEGWVYANVYGTDQIARIEPATGRVAAMIDASGLLTPRERASAEVLNGIAYNPDTETFYLTGKLWPRLFEVVFEPIRGVAGASTVKPQEGARS